MGAPQPPRHLEAVQLGQHHIQNDHVVLARQAVVQPVRPVVYQVGLIALLLHDLAQRLGQPPLVLHDQYPHIARSFPVGSFGPYYNAYGTKPKALNPKVFKADWRCSGARLLADEPENLAPSAGAIRRFGGNTHCNNV